MTAANTDTCEICEVTVSNPGLLSDCSNCGVLFHLNPRNDIPGIDCGDVWVGDCDEPVLQFFCNRCLDLIPRDHTDPGLPGAPCRLRPAGGASRRARGHDCAPPPMPPMAPPAPAAPPVVGAPPPATAPARGKRRRFRRIDGP